MKYNLAEKLAIVKVIDEIIISDGKIDEGELEYLNQLMVQLEFNMDFVNEARQLNATEALLIISNMSSPKKTALKIMMHEMALADGDLHEMEAQTIMAVWQNTGMMDELEVEDKLDLTDVYFESRDHLRHENGEITAGPHMGGAKRAVKIENNINGNDGYSVTIYNLEGESIWGDQVQMAPKQMKVIEESKDKIVLRGYGVDRFGSSFADYGLTVHLENHSIHSIILHMLDRGIDIEYLP